MSMYLYLRRIYGFILMPSVALLAHKRLSVILKNYDLYLARPEHIGYERYVFLIVHLYRMGQMVFDALVLFFGWVPNVPLKALGFENMPQGAVAIEGYHHCDMLLHAMILKRICPIAYVYRRPKNPYFAFIVKRIYHSVSDHCIEKSDVKRLVQAFKEGKKIWVAADQIGHTAMHETPFLKKMIMQSRVVPDLAKRYEASYAQLAFHQEGVAFRYLWEEDWYDQMVKRDVSGFYWMHRLYKRYVRHISDQSESVDAA